MAKLPEPFSTGVGRWSVRRRLEFIEFRLFWEGSVNREDLTEKFGTSPQQGTTDFGAYQKLAPGNCVYDWSRKTYVAGRPFKPFFKKHQPETYLNELRALDEEIQTRFDSWLGVIPPFDRFRFLAPRIEPRVFQAVLRGIQEGRAVLVFYQSSRRPEPELRWITPHAFFEFSGRWFVRGFCHRYGDFRDFQLGRMTKVRNSREHGVRAELDRAWIEQVELEIGIHPAVPAEARPAVALDYGLNDGQVSLPMRLALALRAIDLFASGGDSAASPIAHLKIALLNRLEIEKRGEEIRRETVLAIEDAKIARQTAKRAVDELAAPRCRAS